ncbi:hypothetical protein GQ42DRAFT_163181 [Ramicandelaber brevisporus]|nr:hypothetical protein GQ42DRAFT_163181 [Ramicandelaber brevisporus]
MSSSAKYTYELHYFKYVVGRSEIIRALLALGNISYTLKEYEILEWGQYRSGFPHGQVPVLVIKDASTDEIVTELTESSAIERYIANLIGHHGDNAIEQAQIDAFRLQFEPAVGALYAYYWTPAEGKEQRAAGVKSALENLFFFHERALAKNGGNGHYVGDRITIADLLATQLKQFAIREGFAELVSEEAAPLFNKVVENTLAEPKLKEFYEDVKERNEAQIAENLPSYFCPPVFQLPAKN